jgi:hypothetical protein
VRTNWRCLLAGQVVKIQNSFLKPPIVLMLRANKISIAGSSHTAEKEGIDRL